jgi:hypothetical protein
MMMPVRWCQTGGPEQKHALNVNNSPKSNESATN